MGKKVIKKKAVAPKAAPKRVFKTKKKLTGGGGVYRKWGEWSEGDVVIGKYVGHKIDQYEKPNWMIEVVDAQFSDEDAGTDLIGKVLCLNSSGQLNNAMEKVEEGQLVQIAYNGTSEITKGKYKGKDAHQIEVDLVEEEGAESDDDDEEADEEEAEEEDDI